jgi:hypothetical protein
MKNRLAFLQYGLIFLFGLGNMFAQVGINTNTPNENAALDVNGRVIVKDFSRTAESLSGVKMILSEADGTLIEAELPQSMISKDDTTHAISMTETTYKNTEKIKLITIPSGTINNLDLKLDSDNSDVTVFILRSANNTRIRGIIGGTDGRTIRIINDSGHDMDFKDENSANAAAGNKYWTFTGKDEMKEYGSCLLIYSEAISDDGGHWNIVQLDSFK